MKILIPIIILVLLTGCGMTGFMALSEEPVKICTPNITIASFNLRKFSDTSRTDEELDKVTDVMKQFDLLAVQEVLGSTKILNRTIAMLNTKTGKKYDYAVSAPVGNVQKERYAFIYDTNKVKPTTEGKTYNDKYDKFIREPFYASFKAGEFDFTLMTIHILYGESAADRTDEMKQIADVYTFMQGRDEKENDVILTGDFNTEPWHSNFEYIKQISAVKYAITKGKSTLGESGNLYDNIIFDSSTQEYTNSKGIYLFDEILGLDKDKAQEMVSDHRPVYAVFCTGEDDD